jgi:predicted patatin/cPLA2 family phospholipase
MKRMENERTKLAVCCMSGGYRGVFVQGVLCAWEEVGMRADAYAACSSSTFPASFASFGRVRDLGFSPWLNGYEISGREGNSQSNAIYYGLQNYFPAAREHLWRPDTGRFLLATSFVKTAEAAAMTQGDDATRFGKKLLIQAARRDSRWRDKNLEPHVFDTAEDSRTRRLTAENFPEVAYATTRMLHAWHVPAEIDGKPYIDGSYTTACPVFALAELGYEKVVCVLTEHEKPRYDLFSDVEIPKTIGGTNVECVRPAVDLKELGVDYYTLCEDGVKRVFEHGVEIGREWLATKNIPNDCQQIPPITTDYFL